jgi:N6-adenosine-specific RNA methylase IME4
VTASIPVEQWPLERLVAHAQARLVPAMAADEYAALRADVAEHGVTVALEVTATGTVLDGRHRLLAARELRLSTVPALVVTPADEIEHIIGAALNRRHLSASQKAALAVELDEYRGARTAARNRRHANLKQSSEEATLPPRNERSREIAARTAGVSPRTIQDAETVRQADPDLFADVKEGRVAAHVAARKVRRARRDPTLVAAPLPDGPFEMIYADPPWQLGNPSSAYAPENHYPTMATGEIAALQVPAAENAMLFLWAVSSRLPDALQVMEAWGFGYRTSIVWVKDWIGLGTWVRHRHELLLIGRRGSHPAPDPEDRPDSVIQQPRRRHSEKPDCAYELIERMYPQASRLELFARSARPGWHAWGNQLDQAA